MENSPDAATAITRTARQIKTTASTLAKINPDMTIRAVQLLCAVIDEPGQTVTVYAKALGMPLSTTSRLLLDLSETSRAKAREEGAHLLIRKPNPLSYREVLYYPSPVVSALLFRLSEAYDRNRRAFGLELTTIPAGSNVRIPKAT